MPMLLTAPAPTLTVADRVRWAAGDRPRPARALTARLASAGAPAGPAAPWDVRPAGPRRPVPVRTVSRSTAAARHRRAEPLTLPERGLRQVQRWAARRAA